MPPRKRRYSRSRNGCQQCRRVSSKCDETLPICNRCRRLNKPCDYSKVLVWHGKHAQEPSNFSIDRTRSRVHPNGAQSSAEDLSQQRLPVSLENFHKDDFVRRSQKLLHWTEVSNNPILSKIGPLSSQVLAIKDALIALEQIHRGSLLPTLDSIDRVILSLKAELTKDSILEQTETVSACAFLVVQLSMRAGYCWTLQLSALKGLAMTNPADHIILEQIAGLDMNAWIIGRQSEPQHIWYHHCMGRPGYESITGLPRSFLDIVSRASLSENVGSDLEVYISSVPKDGTDKSDIILTFALALRLYLHKHVQQQQDCQATVNDLSEIVSRLWSCHQDDSTFNERVLIWPTYMICCTAEALEQDNQARQLLLRILELSSGTSFQDPILRIMDLYWNRKELGVSICPDSIARELGIEVGLW